MRLTRKWSILRSSVFSSLFRWPKEVPLLLTRLLPLLSDSLPLMTSNPTGNLLSPYLKSPFHVRYSSLFSLTLVVLKHCSPHSASHPSVELGWLLFLSVTRTCPSRLAIQPQAEGCCSHILTARVSLSVPCPISHASLFSPTLHSRHTALLASTESKNSLSQNFLLHHPTDLVLCIDRHKNNSCLGKEELRDPHY